jgi:hypothetical protein
MIEKKTRRWIPGNHRPKGFLFLDEKFQKKIPHVRLEDSEIFGPEKPEKIRGAGA